jgi:hypothetical protein
MASSKKKRRTRAAALPYSTDEVEMKWFPLEAPALDCEGEIVTSFRNTIAITEELFANGTFSPAADSLPWVASMEGIRDMIDLVCYDAVLDAEVAGQHPRPSRLGLLKNKKESGR